ncbi:MAG: S8 family serine peptidase [Gaiellaceae bacterium]
MDDQRSRPPINGVGISGVAPKVTLVEGKVLSGAGSGLFLWTDQALVYAGLQHFDIVSASLGGYIPKCGNVKNNPLGCDHPDFILLNRATQFARSNGVLPIAAAGNEGWDLSNGSFFRNFIEAPGEVAGWVTVGATGYADNNKNKPHMSPTAVESFLQTTANNQPCPQPNTVTQGPGSSSRPRRARVARGTTRSSARGSWTP